MPENTHRNAPGTPPIIVGVDARPLTRPISGIPRYLYGVLNDLTLDRRFRFLLLSNKRIITDLADRPNVTVLDDSSVDYGKTRRPGPFDRLTARYGTPWLMTHTNRLIRRHHIDIFWGPQHILPWLKTSNVKYLVTVHDLVHRVLPSSMTFRNQMISRIFLARSVYNADQIITVSQTTRRDLLRFYPGINPDSVETVYSGRPPVQHPTGTPPVSGSYLFCLGSIEPRKNLLFLLKAFNRLVSRLPEFKLVLGGGDGWKSGPVLDYIRQNNLDKKVILTGYLSDPEIVPYLAHARLFVFPSLYEGFGLPLIEAVGLCPAVASDIDVFREVGEHLKNLEYCDFKQSPDQTAERLQHLLSRNDAPRLEFASEKNRELFTWKTAAKATANIMIRLAGEETL